MLSPLSIVAAALLSQPAPDNAAEARQAADVARGVVEHYELTIGDGERLQIEPEPVLRWTNQLSRRFYGDVFVWTRDGRPEVVASVTNVFGTDHRSETEFHSLSLDQPVLRIDDAAVWRPTEPGVEFTLLRDVPPPASNAAARLSQMRRVAGRFSAITETDRETRKLRLLPTPIFRYSRAPNVTDGGLFAFVNGTDPEVFLLLEARSDPQPGWVYAFARFNGHCRITVRLGDEDVWNVEVLSGRAIRDTSRPYFARRNPVP